MQCSCERDALFRTLTICADLCRVFPDMFQVTLRAHTGVEGSLDVFLWAEDNGVGVLASVPAEVIEAGSVTVPTYMTTSALAAMPQGHLSLSSIMIPEPDPVSKKELIKPLKGGPALQIEGASETGTTQRTRLRLCTPTSEQTGPPVLAEWQRRGLPLACITPSALRKAWEPCVLLAQERIQASAKTPDMDHAQVLLRFDPHRLVCTATTRSAVAQTTLPWTKPPGEMPSPHLLVDERMLRWIMKALKKETHPVTFTLFPQEAPAALLLFSLPHYTLVCRGKTAPIPLVWERRIGASSSQALLLSRAHLVKALDFLSADRAGYAERHILLSSVNQHLCLQREPQTRNDHAAVCHIPLVNTAAERSPVLIHLQRLRRVLRQIKGATICLEQGTITYRLKKGEAEALGSIGFVRLSKPADATIQMLMTISACSSPPPGAAPVSETRGESEKGGATLATV